MRGDKLVIHDGHRRAARQIMPLLLPQIEKTRSTFIITVAGESGSGKSEISAVLSKSLLEEGIKSLILQQDDFLEKILEIEHKIISSHKPRAYIIVTKNYEVEKNDSTG